MERRKRRLHHRGDRRRREVGKTKPPTEGESGNQSVTESAVGMKSGSSEEEDFAEQEDRRKDFRQEEMARPDNSAPNADVGQMRDAVPADK